MLLFRYLMLFVLLGITLPGVSYSQPGSHHMKQPREVVEAYRVCGKFQQLIAENLDFDRAFEATFTTNMRRRREIAIYDGEFGGVDLSRIDDVTLISAYKSRMQIFFLMLPLVSPNDNEEELLFFPADVKEIFARKPPTAPEQFQAYAAQLNSDAEHFRSHLERLARQYPSVAARVLEFKRDISKEIALPTQIVKPLTAYSKGRVLGLDEKYYQIGDYAVIREGTQMRIVGIRFFSRLF